ncbi:GNAT family protein [Nonomuraea sp. SYSU D8015]|uniref:GNAT family protein n=1 Tax=Nonomuraea sp. SYSU D8015 TaxID=2593644 RepID=UPI001661816A|nr:GNAT family protein [Nonomuraea sp. SYSU D8015]
MIFPHLDVGRTALRCVDPLDSKGAHGFLTEHGSGGGLSHEVLSVLWAVDLGEVAAQFQVEARDTGRVAGLSVLQRLDLNGGHVQAGVFVDPADEEVRSAASALTVNYAFANWSVRKVYVWTVEEDLAELREASEIVRREATLREFVHDGGLLRDLTIFAVYREDWARVVPNLLRRLSRAGAVR